MPVTKHFMLRYPSKKQVEIWSLKRTQITNDQQTFGKELAKQMNISPAAVSQTLSKANGRIIALIKNAVKMNKIRVDLLSPELGFARGESLIFKTRTYITYSPENGVQIWYDHKGDCEGCEEFGECRRDILQEFKERNLRPPNPMLRPTDLVETLVKQLERMLE